MIPNHSSKLAKRAYHQKSLIYLYFRVTEFVYYAAKTKSPDHLSISILSFLFLAIKSIMLDKFQGKYNDRNKSSIWCCHSFFSLCVVKNALFRYSHIISVILLVFTSLDVLTTFSLFSGCVSMYTKYNLSSSSFNNV